MIGLAKHLKRVHRARDSQHWSGRFEGKDLGTGITVLFFSSVETGAGPLLHVHPYNEMFIVRQGRARFTVGDGEVLAEEGDVVLGPANIPHKLRKTRAGTLGDVGQVQTSSTTTRSRSAAALACFSASW